MDPLHNPYAYAGFTPQDATNAPPGQTGQEPAAGGLPCPPPHLFLRSQALPGLSGYEPGPPHAPEAGTRTPPVAAAVSWPTQASYSTALPSALAGWGQERQPQQPGGALPAAPGYPVPEVSPAFMPGYPPPSLERQPVLPAAPYGPSAPVPLVPAWGAAAAQAGLRAGGASKRPAPDATAPGRAQPKRLLVNRPGAEVAAAAAGRPGPAWPETWPTTSKIDCPESVLANLRRIGKDTRQAQFEHYELKTGVISIKAVVQACGKVAGRLVAEHGEMGVYAFGNVVLTARTKITRLDRLVEDQRIGTVYLELGKAENGTAALSDLHLLIPEAVSATPQTSGPVYSNDEAAILDYMRSKIKGKKTWEVRRLAKQHKAEQPAPSHPFRPGKALNSYWRDHKSFCMTLGCKYFYHVNDLLRECENALGSPPGDGEHRLTLMRGGQEHRLLWVVEGSYTTHLIDARDEEEAQQELTRSRFHVTKIRAAQLAKSGVMPRTLRDEVRSIAERREKELTALAWDDDLEYVVRDLSARCEMARFDSKYDSIKSCPEDEEVMEFHLQPPRESGGKPARGLRWVREDKVIEIIPFEEGEREEAIKKMAEFKKRSNAARERWVTRKMNAAARAGGADG